MKLKKIFEETVELTSVGEKTDGKILGWCASHAFYCQELKFLVVDHGVDVITKGRVLNDQIDAPKMRIFETILDPNVAIRRAIELTDLWKISARGWAAESTFKIE